MTSALGHVLPAAATEFGVVSDMSIDGMAEVVAGTMRDELPKPQAEARLQ